MTLALAAVAQNPLAQIILAHPAINDDMGKPGIYTIAGVVQDNFGAGGSSDYSNPFQSHMQEVNATIQAVASSTAKKFGWKNPIPNLNSQMQSLHQYISSERPTFQVSFTLIRYQRAMTSVSKIGSRLVAAQYPIGGNRYAQQAFLKSPGYYNPSGRDSLALSQKNQNPTNTWTLQIGEYFRADELILRHAEVQYSKECVFDGTPLYGTVTAALEPIVIPTEADVRSWFLK